MWGFMNQHFENSPVDDKARDQAQGYLKRIVALTNATQFDDGYLLNVGTNRFHVHDRYVRRLQGAKDPTIRFEQTCFFVPNQRLPRAEQIATALLMLKNDPTLFNKWTVKNGESYKADGRVFGQSVRQ
jgi:hypothetical protein